MAASVKPALTFLDTGLAHEVAVLRCSVVRAVVLAVAVAVGNVSRTPTRSNTVQHVHNEGSASSHNYLDYSMDVQLVNGLTGFPVEWWQPCDEACVRSCLRG